MDPLYSEETIDGLRSLKKETGALVDGLMPALQPDIREWTAAVDARLIPRLMASFPLAVAICGGGSSGKSTLFNALVGHAISPTGGRAGINRRLLVSIRASYRHTPQIAEVLFEPLGYPPKEMAHMDQLTTVGDPLLSYSTALPAGLALMDTPDFDTGSKGSYQNRDMAERALHAADVFIYIFTNANYNNRDNTDFIARMLTTVGIRKCMLVYRVYPSFTAAEVRSHAQTVARNLYGEDTDRHVLGIFRADEDNRVAAGQKSMAITPVDGAQPGLLEALEQIDPRKLRGELHRSVFADVIEKGHGFVQSARASKDHLATYLDLLDAMQKKCVQDALGHLPMDAVIRRFSEIWQEADPSHVKIMRTTGRVVETPVRLLMGVGRWVGGKGKGRAKDPSGGKMAATMEADFVRAANRLRRAAVDQTITVRLSTATPGIDSLCTSVRRLSGLPGVSERRTESGMIELTVPAHPALSDARKRVQSLNWEATIEQMMANRDQALDLTLQLENELKRLVDEQRARMTTFDQIRQTFSAMLNIIPATAAVTYVLHTGDPVGATGIKVKLAGLFGLNDLYALVAIPATAGMKKADVRQLEALLAPVARAWLTHKLKAIDTMFHDTITAPLLDFGGNLVKEADGRIAAMDETLAGLDRILEKRG